MSNVALTLQERINLVRSAIERIRDAREKHLETQADPTADSDDRGAARESFRDAERDFGNQWQNVEVILQEGLREELG